MMGKEKHVYDDIINLPHHVSDKHPRMPIYDRAAQFSPFAALTGHTDAIKETERIAIERYTLEEKGEKDSEYFEFQD